jgi:replicative DNA helicase
MAEAPLTARRELPHAVELERAVLAALLDGGSAAAVHLVREQLNHPLVFFERNHRLLFQAILDLDDDGERIDATVVADRLHRSDFQVSLERLRRQQALLEAEQLDNMGRDRLRALYRFRPEDAASGYDQSALAAVGGYAWLAEISGAFAGFTGLGRNAALVRDYYLKRRLIQRLTAIGDQAHRTTEPFDTLVDGASQVVLELSRMGATASVHSLGEVLDETLVAITESAGAEDRALRAGIPPLDRMLTLRPGGLYVLAARPGVGKTSFALSVVQNIAQALPGEHILFFSLEVDRIDLVKKLLSSSSNIDFGKIEKGNLSPEEHQALADAATAMRDQHIDLMDVSDLTVQGMRSVVKRHMLQTEQKLRLVVLDYLQLLGASRPDMSEYEKVSEISRTLKILARELRLPIVALSQMSRESERGATKPREPRLADLRGSGSVEQDADAVVFLHRMDEGEDARIRDDGRDVKVIVAKNRFGENGSFLMKFFPARQRFLPAAESREGETVEALPPSGTYGSAPSEDENLFL